MERALSIDSIKDFFSNFIEQYQIEIKNKFKNEMDKFLLFNSLPVRIDIIIDNENKYGIIILSKSKSAIMEFSVEILQDPMMVVAVANSKRYQYGEEKSFLYLFQVNSKKFPLWDLNHFIQDFINLELANNSKKK